MTAIVDNTFAQCTIEKVRVLQNKLHQAAKKDLTLHAACMLTFALIIGKPYEGKPHVRFDEEVEET